MVTDEELKAIEDRLKKATAGPGVRAVYVFDAVKDVRTLLDEVRLLRQQIWREHFHDGEL